MSAPVTVTPVVDEPVTTQTTVLATEEVVAPVTEEPKETPAVATEEAAAAAPAIATTTEEAVASPTEEATTAPALTPSKSTPSKRLSLLLGKAKHFVDKKVSSDKKPVANKEEVHAHGATEETVAETAEPAAVEEVAATTEEPVVAKEPEVKAPKFEKRKSILSGIFRSKVTI